MNAGFFRVCGWGFVVVVFVDVGMFFRRRVVGWGEGVGFSGLFGGFWVGVGEVGGGGEVWEKGGGMG